jgi:hypothetical protein
VELVLKRDAAGQPGNRRRAPISRQHEALVRKARPHRRLRLRHNSFRLDRQ